MRVSMADAFRKAELLDQVQAIVAETGAGMAGAESTRGRDNWRCDGYGRIAALLVGES